MWDLDLDPLDLADFLTRNAEIVTMDSRCIDFLFGLVFDTRLPNAIQYMYEFRRDLLIPC